MMQPALGWEYGEFDTYGLLETYGELADAPYSYYRVVARTTPGNRHVGSKGINRLWGHIAVADRGLDILLWRDGRTQDVDYPSDVQTQEADQWVPCGGRIVVVSVDMWEYAVLSAAGYELIGMRHAKVDPANLLHQPKPLNGIPR